MRAKIAGALIILIILVGCSSQSENQPPNIPATPEKTWDESELLSKVKLGATRSEITSVLGQPFMVQESENGGTICMYILGMPDMQEMMRGSQTMGLAQSALGIAGGLTGPIGGVASSVGSQVLSIGSELSAASAMPDPSQMRMIVSPGSSDLGSKNESGSHGWKRS